MASAPFVGSEIFGSERSNNGHGYNYYFEPGRRTAPSLLTRDEAPHRRQHRQAAGAAAQGRSGPLRLVTGAAQFPMQMTMTPAAPPSSAHL
jgi:hypothetical protein